MEVDHKDDVAYIELTTRKRLKLLSNKSPDKEYLGIPPSVHPV